jgi:hypothetical protein
MLKADIAVLEGGYAIEGALPYVNTGIILAMAGLDFSHLREPDYNPKELYQSQQLTEAVEKTCERVMETWHRRREYTEALHAKKGSNQRKRRIFYDTDNIMENQDETIRVCYDCAGALRIDSSSDNLKRILGVHIPRKACPACQEQGHQWFDEARADDFDHIFLQDRPNDTYSDKLAPTRS